MYAKKQSWEGWERKKKVVGWEKGEKGEKGVQEGGVVGG